MYTNSALLPPGVVRSSGAEFTAAMCSAMRDIIAEEGRWVSLLHVQCNSDAATVVHNLIDNHEELMRCIPFRVHRHKKGDHDVRYYEQITIHR